MVATGAAVLLLPAVAVDGLVGPYVDAKAWLLVLLVAAAGVAWLAAPAASPATPGGDRLALTFRVAVLAYLGWGVVTTAASIAPGLSVWGDFARAQGLVTVAAVVVLGAVIWTRGRSAAGVRPLVDLALLGSIPVCLLALGQAAGWDPLPETERDPAMAALRVRSTLGTHIFLGSYLGLLAPLTLARMEWALREARGGAPPKSVGPASPRLGTRPVWGLMWGAGTVAIVGLAAAWPAAAWAIVPLGVSVAAVWTRSPHAEAAAARPRGTIWLLAGLLTLQILVTLLTRARGPFLGLLVGLSVAELGLLATRRAWAALTAAGTALAAIVAVLVLLNIPTSPLAPLRAVPALSRFARLTETRPGSPGWVRLQVWGGIVHGWKRQVSGEPVLPRRAPIVRSLVGYGPETQGMTIEPLVRPRLGSGRTSAGERWIQYFVDRAHNDPLDHLLAGGLIGLAAWLAVAGTLLALGAARIAGSPPHGDEVALRLGALGAVIGHLVETQVGIETPSSRVVFALAAGLLTMPAWNTGTDPAARATSWRVVAGTILAVLAAAGSTGWLLASAAYTRGSRAWATKDAGGAHRAFAQASDFAPWLARPAEATAEVALTLASGEPDGRRRVALLHAAEEALGRARRAGWPGGDHWALQGQVAYAEAMAGIPGRISRAVDAYTEAARLRPHDGQVHALRALALLDAGNPAAAREAAERAIALDRASWVSWAVLARSAQDLGDPTGGQAAAKRARDLAPAAAGALLDRVLPGTGTGPAAARPDPAGVRGRLEEGGLFP